MLQFILKENVLSDNVLCVPKAGMVFKGGYIAIAQEYTYSNPWSNRLKVTRFRTVSQLNKFLKKYPEAEIDFTDTAVNVRSIFN